MRNYIIKRLLISVVILLVVAFIIYSLMRSMPTSYVEKIARERANLPGSKSYTEWIQQLNQIYGLDSGIIKGFFGWLKNVFQGDFGDSWYYNVPVTEKFKDTVWYSFARITSYNVCYTKLLRHSRFYCIAFGLPEYQAE